MKKEIQKMIPPALEAVKKYLLNNNKVQKEYDGYAASLGAAIRNSGLIPALCFYTDISRKDGDARRWKLLMAVGYVLGDHTLSVEDNDHQKALLEKVVQSVYGTQGFNDANANFINNSSENKTELKKCKREILHASIALKLAMRNFPHTEKENS